MNKKSCFNYDSMFYQALQRIRAEKYSPIEPQDSAGWNEIKEYAIFDLDEESVKNQYLLLKKAKEISIDCIRFIIVKMVEIKGISLVEIDEDEKQDPGTKPFLILRDSRNSHIYYFRDMEQCRFWKLKSDVSERISNIYLMYEKAYAQMMGHNLSEIKESDGTNLYSIIWFWETFFGREEAMQFKVSLKRYVDSIKNYLEVIQVKKLSPWALSRFKLISQKNLFRTEFERLLTTELYDKVSQSNISLPQKDYFVINSSFYSDKTIGTIYGNADFSVSFITGEWLFDVMNKANAVDLTIVGLGYIKTIEQLIFSLAKLQINTGKNIKVNGSKNKIYFSDDNLREDKLDLSLGSLAVFIGKYADEYFNPSISEMGRRFVIESIFSFNEKRKNYFHKNNIVEWKEIEELKSSAYNLIFLLLGSIKISEVDYNKLEYKEIKRINDYDSLAEFVENHARDIFEFVDEKGASYYFTGERDYFAEINGDDVKYSGVYFRELMGKQFFKITKEDLPKMIYLCKFGFDESKEDFIDLTHIKRVCKIYENDKYVGPSLLEDIKGY